MQVVVVVVVAVVVLRDESRSIQFVLRSRKVSAGSIQLQLRGFCDELEGAGQDGQIGRRDGVNPGSSRIFQLRQLVEIFSLTWRIHFCLSCLEGVFYEL